MSVIPRQYAASEPGRAPAARADRDAVPPREADEVGDDQEVVGEPHLADGLELEAQPLVELRVRRAVAPEEALLALLEELVEGIAPLRKRELRQQDPTQLDLHVAALRDLEAPPHRLLVPGEVERHLGRRLEVELVRLELPVVRVLQRVPRLDAEQRLVRVRVGSVEVVDVAGRDDGKPPLRRERGQRLEERLLDVDVPVLELDVGRVAAEDLREPVEVGLCIARAVLHERARDAPAEAAGEGEHALRMALEQLPVDAGLVVVALEVAERAELDEVAVADVVRREERQVGVALVLLPAIVDDVDLAADDRLDPLLLCGLEELDRARHRPVVGEGHRRHLELRCLPRQGRDPARPVEDRILGVDVQVDERRAHGKAMVVRRSAGQTRRICR